MKTRWCPSGAIIWLKSASNSTNFTALLPALNASFRKKMFMFPSKHLRILTQGVPEAIIFILFYFHFFKASCWEIHRHSSFFWTETHRCPGIPHIQTCLTRTGSSPPLPLLPHFTGSISQYHFLPTQLLSRTRYVVFFSCPPALPLHIKTRTR